MMPISRPVGSRCPTCFHRYHTVLALATIVSVSLLEWRFVIGALLRIYSYLYHLALALLLLGISVVAVSSHSHTFNLGMLPWTGTTLACWLFGAGFVGLLSILLAWMGKLRFLFLLYALAVFVMM